MTPEARALHEAVERYSGKAGMNAATIGTVTQKIIGLLSSRWEHICDVAMDEPNGGQVNVCFTIHFDMTRKAPCGKVLISFTQRTKDEADFQVDDPTQTSLPFAQAVGREATPLITRTPRPRRGARVTLEALPSGTPIQSPTDRPTQPAGTPNGTAAQTNTGAGSSISTAPTPPPPSNAPTTTPADAASSLRVRRRTPTRAEVARRRAEAVAAEVANPTPA
jgi:hypothetical protein